MSNQNQNQSQGAKRFDPNTTTVGGRLSKKPEIRYTPNQKAVTNVTLANNVGDQTNWVDVVIWGAQAERLCQHLDKGSYIIVEGQLQTRTYKGDNDKNVKVTEVLARSVYWMDNVGKSSNNGQSTDQSYGQPQNQQYGDQNYGQPQNQQYGGQPQNQQYGGQPQNQQYGGQPQNQQYGGQPQNQQYGGQPQNQQYGGQPAYNGGNAANTQTPDVPNGGITININEDDLPF